MPIPRSKFVVTALTAAAAAVFAAPAAATVSCDVYAAPAGSDTAAGTSSAPFRTAQRLADSLAPGQTGCLRAGTYDHEVRGPYVLRFERGGTAGAPITIRSAPGERASLRGILYVPPSVGHVTLADVDFDGRRPVNPGREIGMQVTGPDFTLTGSTITNTKAMTSCMTLGVSGWGRAVRTTIVGNHFKDCGNTVDGNLDHAIYLNEADSPVVTDNIFVGTAAYAVHLYGDVRGGTVTHNVMDANGGGVIFAGYGTAVTSGVTVEHNLITRSFLRPAIESYWSVDKGTGNVARTNCLNNARNVDLGGGGFTAVDNVISDPLFVDAAAGDYRLRDGSPCLAVVGYDTAAKLAGAPQPAAATTPTGTTTTGTTTTGTTTTDTTTTTPTTRKSNRKKLIATASRCLRVRGAQRKQRSSGRTVKIRRCATSRRERRATYRRAATRRA